MKELLENLEYNEVRIGLKEKIYRFLFSKGIIKSPNWIFGGK